MFSQVSKLLFGLLFSLLFITLLTLGSAVLWSQHYFPDDLVSPEKLLRANEHYVLEPVSIVDVKSGSITHRQSITIDQGRIVSIANADLPIKSEIKKIDGGNAYVVPGLIDMHTHIYDRKDLVNSLANGVTSVRNMRGLPLHLRIKDEINNDRWVGASLYTSSPVLDNSNADFFQHSLDSIAEAEKAVEDYKQAGYDLLKVYNLLPKEILIAITQKAHSLSMPIAKHGSFGWADGDTFDTTLLSTFRSVEHVEEIYQTVLSFNFNEERLNKHLAEIKDSGTFLTPTLATFNHLSELSKHKEAMLANIELARISPFFRFILKPLSVQRWLDASNDQIEWNDAEFNILMEITKKAHEHEIPMLVGSDQGTMFMVAGRSTHEEMQLLQRAGLSPLSVLRAATMNAAKALGVDAQIGTVSVGKKADLLLLKMNPLEDTSNLAVPEMIIKHGHIFDQDGITALNESGLKPANWFIGLGYLIEDLVSRATAF